MSKYLVIIESPGKIKKIKSYLGKDYKILASYGHIMDLPAKGMNVDIKNEFKPTYKVSSDKKNVVKAIKEEAKKTDIVYLASDIDREGEKISQSISTILPKGTTFKRLRYNSITKNSILKAIEDAGEIDSALVDAYEARRILDRICGYRTSFITQQATGGRSAGRVQSAALRIIADREKEIQGFVPQEYWDIKALLERKNKDNVWAYLKKPDKLKVKNKKQADEICEVLKSNKIKVTKYDTKEVNVKAYAPFTTSTLYQATAGVLGWNSSKTAIAAQKLYEIGEISYHRTDSTYIVPDFISAIRDTVVDKYGDNYVPDKANTFSNKKSAQEAHEAIRVTDLVLERSSLGGDENKLYELIWKKTVSSQMASCRQLRGNAEFECKEYILAANGSKVVFDGWRRVWTYGKSEDTELPEFVVGEEVKLKDLTSEQKFTQPPPRYNDASIIKELEKRGIGRPSTFKSIISTLLDRSYVEREKKAFHATEMGVRVSDFLIEVDMCFIDLEFTQNLENELDQIANSEKCKLEVLTNFYNRLKSDCENATVIRNEKSMTDYPCKKCDGKLVLKHSKWGPFLVCEHRKNKENPCDYKCDADKSGKPKEREEKEIKYSDKYKCSNCNSYLVIRINKRGGEYLGCENWKQTECQGFYSAETGKKIEFKKKKWKKKKN
jgi:DNA topoisomerase I